jgi:16S rRNA (cytosine967-C5)-methyltransferase
VIGVLHWIAREWEGVAFTYFAVEAVGHLTTWCSNPSWLVELLFRVHGTDGASRIVEANNRRPGVYLRPVGAAAADVRAALQSEDIPTAFVDGDPEMLSLVEPASVGHALSLVRAVVQDPAAARVARFAAPDAGERVADLCAAPGGKAIGIAGDRARPPSFVVACDASFDRLGRLRDNVLRLAPLPVGLVVADARRPAVRAVEHVLLDVPCTGTGTLARHPDGRWRLREQDLDALVGLQRTMLRAAAACVVPGGTLVYATCSIEPEENERQVEAFLQDHENFALEAPADPDAADVDERGRLCVLPAADRYDGAFAARMKRRG